MLPKNFRIAMRNALRVGPYGMPHATTRSTQEWLIVERLGDEGEIIRISDASAQSAANGHDAPDALVVNNTIIGLLAERDFDARASAQFLLIRHFEHAADLEGIFFPADGFALLTGGANEIGLRAFGRHAHSTGQIGGHTVYFDTPHPAPQSASALNWHFDAIQVPWINQAHPKNGEKL